MARRSTGLSETGWVPASSARRYTQASRQLSRPCTYLLCRGSSKRGTASPVPLRSAGDVLSSLDVRPAEAAAELRAAASLRAVAFYTYPSGRSDFSTQVGYWSSHASRRPVPGIYFIFELQAHRRMKADEEWRELEEKIAGKHPHYKVKPGATCKGLFDPEQYMPCPQSCVPSYMLYSTYYR